MKRIYALVLALSLAGTILAQTVTSITPNSGHQGATINIQVVCTGMNFNSSYPYAINFNYNGSGGSSNFNSSNPTVVNSTTLSASLTIPSGFGSLIGQYDVVVTNQQTSASATGTKLFTVTGANGIADVEAEGFHVYPVPATGQLYIDAASEHKVSELTLTSLDGQVLRNQAGSSDSHMTVDIQGINAGVYILSVKDLSGTISYQKVAIK